MSEEKKEKTDEKSYIITFLPQGSKNSFTINVSQDAVLSDIRQDQTQLSQYLFLPKTDATKNNTQQMTPFGKSSESKTKVKSVATQDDKIFMIHKDDLDSGLTEVKFVFQGQKESESRKIKVKITLDELRKQYQKLESYFFVKKDKTSISLESQKNIKVLEILQNKQIHMRKNEARKQKKTYVIKFKESLHSEMQVTAYPQDYISVLRSNTELESFKFLNRSGAKLSSSTQKSTKLKEIVIEDIIYMKPTVTEEQYKKETKEKKQQMVAKQKQRMQSLDKLMKDIKDLKGDINKDGNKQRMAELSRQLKQEGIPLSATKLSDEHTLTSVLQTLAGKKNDCQTLLDYAKKIEQRPDWEIYAQNGLFLPTIYPTKKPKVDQINLVNFQKTVRTLHAEVKKSYKVTMIEYEAVENSSVKVDMSNTSQYEFNGGSLGVSVYGVGAKIKAGKAELSQSQHMTATKGVKAGERVNHSFFAFEITNGVSFHKDHIFLKKNIVDEFEKIVSQYQKSQNYPVLQASLSKFTDKYGVGLLSSIYFLGGIYNNTIQYQFLTQATSSDISTITRDETQSTLAVSVSGSYGPVSAQAGYQHSTKNKNEKAWKNSVTGKSVKYTTRYYHNAAPLSSIEDINLWRTTVQSFPKNMIVVGITDKTEIPLTYLLGTPNNSVNMDRDFIKAKNYVLKELQRQNRRNYFKVIIDQHDPNLLVSKDSIRKGGDQSEQYQFLGKDQIPKHGTYTYVVKILCSKNMEIGIGICCQSCKDNQFSRPQHHEVICYRLEGLGCIEFGDDHICPEVIIKEQGQIRVVVNTTALSAISWYYQDKLVAKVEIPVYMIKNGVYPYFQMLENGDVIKII